MISRRRSSPTDSLNLKVTDMAINYPFAGRYQGPVSAAARSSTPAPNSLVNFFFFMPGTFFAVEVNCSTIASAEAFERFLLA